MIYNKFYILQILSALTCGKVEIPQVTSLVHNQGRRQAIAGLDDSLNVLAEKLFGNMAGPFGLSQESEGSSDEEVTQVRETLITGRLHTNTNSMYSEEEKVAEEEVDSDDVTQPLTMNYKNKRDSEFRISRMSSRSNRKSVNDSDNENCRKSYKKRENDGRNSKISIRSDLSKTSKRTFDSEGDKRSYRSHRKRGNNAYHNSCSDLENCTDDAKWIQSEGEGKGSCKKINVGVATDSSLGPEQLNYTYQSASTVSVGGHPQHGREIGTQTNVSFNNKEITASVSGKPKRKKSNASRQKLSSAESSLK